jgi:dipeptidyl aminopeptidase/acylaminoacyl peptidase
MLFGSRLGSMTALAWAAGAKSVLFAHRASGSPRLFRISAEGGSQPELLAGIGEDVADISVAGGRLVYGVDHSDTDLWRMSIEGGRVGPESRFAVSSRIDSNPRFSPDGSRIAFVSDRAGARDVWVVNADGTGPRQITKNFNTSGFAPSWSFDGSSIVFGAAPVTARGVYRVKVDGGTPEQIGPLGAMSGFHSHDRKSIYVLFAKVGDGYQFLKIDPSVKDSATTVPDFFWRARVLSAEDSPDGKWIWFNIDDGKSFGLIATRPALLARLAVTGGEPQPLAAHEGLAAMGYGKDGVYFVERGSRKLQLCRYADQKVVDIAEFPEGQLPFRGTNLSFRIFTISPDRKTIVYAKPSSTTLDLMLVENFK